MMKGMERNTLTSTEISEYTVRFCNSWPREVRNRITPNTMPSTRVASPAMPVIYRVSQVAFSN
ncbi:hypothetical protein D3C79_1080630 [compost metagenome]